MNNTKIKILIYKIPKSLRIGLVILVALFLLFHLLDKLFPLDINTEYSCIIYSGDSNLIHGFLTSDDKWRMFTELNEISPELKKAIIFKEDKYFEYHFGINPVAIIRAFYNNIKTGKRTSGASTITMQVARLIEPKQRTYINKIKEMFRATQFEWHYSKDEILQLYLNIIPFGGNIEGVKSTSIIYFGKLPNHLSLAEITTLSIIPNRPVSLRLGKNNEYILKERNKWLARFKKAGLFDDKVIEDALDEPLNTYRREVPKMAPHLSYRLKNLYPEKEIIITSIDIGMQKKLEKIVNNYSKRLYFQNIKNAITLVIENRTGKIKAYIGSADFYNEEDGGQVDGIKAVRSPGSTLKPLLYALAIEKGLITPKTVISDVPVSFGGYEPENYDGNFYGNISLEFALANSLNVPAVKILKLLEIKTMMNRLILAGFKQIKKDRNYLGLSLILGGCGTSLEELTNLYSAFANEGKYKKAGYLLNENHSDEKEIISQEAAFIITEILTQLTRPDLPLDWKNSVHMPKIAWKTGTSYGRRDAWSIGYNKKYTVGTWVGNFSGQGVPELSGAEKASPLLFKIFNTIDYDSEEEWYNMPPELDFRYVCTKTGMPSNIFCKSEVLDYFIAGISDVKKCDHLKEILINPDSTFSFCTSCKPETGYITALYPNISAEIITYYETNNIRYLKIPDHNPECERLLSGTAPVITSPINDNEYFLDVEDEMEIMLGCHAANDVKTVYWYINNKFYKAVQANEKVFFKPAEGKVKISCSDDKGRNTDIIIIVKYISF